MKRLSNKTQKIHELLSSNLRINYHMNIVLIYEFSIKKKND